MISIILAFITFAILISKGTIRHARRIEETREAYRKEGKEFPFEIMASVQSEMSSYPERFIESEENEALKKERIKLLKDYKRTNIHPIKSAALVLGICLPIEILGWYIAYRTNG